MPSSFSFRHARLLNPENNFTLLALGAAGALSLTGVSIIRRWWRTRLAVQQESQQQGRKNEHDGPRPPPHLCSWIPYIGSALELQKGHIRDFIQTTAARLKAPAFTATIMGDKCLFIADSHLLGFIFRDSKQLDGLTFQKRFLQNTLGFTAAQNEALFDPNSETPKAVMSLFHKHLLKDDALKTLLRKTQNILVDQVHQLFDVVPLHQDNANTTNNNNDNNNNNKDWTRHNLFEFVSTTVFRASAGPILSMNLNANCAEYLQQLRNFEKDMGLLFAGAPTFMVPQGHRARQFLIHLFDSDLVRSAESPFLQERRQTLYQGVGQDPILKDVMDLTVARNNMGIFLATVGNSIQTVFWTLLHLLQDTEAYEACRASVREVVASRHTAEDQEREWFTLPELDQLVLLQSVFQESLRMYQTLFITRQAVKDFVLNPKDPTHKQYLIQKGTMIMGFPNSMHMDPTIFVEPHTWRYNRFADPQTKSPQGTFLTSHLRPFGGGAHMCPGRKFISYEARALLAMLLLKCDMRLTPGVCPPGIDLSRQGMSVSVPEHDVPMEIRLL